ncbi:MAG TPA: hypothetical protein VH394_02035 [Thermoanaerobaculia bacterium]|jgi:hypothetical protein|nr:hypothetical protein [Thermoanaerobaculia bacterium]
MGIRRLAALGALLLAPVLPKGLPEGVTPLPREMETRVEQLLHEAETWRGLKVKEPVPSGSVDDSVLRQKMLESFREELPPEVLRPAETGLKAFGFIPEDLDLVKFFPELLSSQVAGYYDPERHYFALVQREELSLDPDVSDEAKRLMEAVLVHELTHALQDQYFHLETFTTNRPLDDADVARLALVEGDATLVMIDFFAQTSLETMPGSEQMASMLGDPQQMLGSGVPGAAEMLAAPAWFQDTLLFSYAQGFQFCLDVRRKGGQALLDKAFSTDPPRSSEQILHPEKWHTKRDDPVGIAWPALPLSGWKKVSEGQLGELSVRTLVRDVAKQDQAQAVKAAAGWGGDQFAVYDKDGRRLLVWISEWDSDADARELQGALRGLGRDWAVKRSGKRVVVTRGEVSRELRAALKKRT